MAKRTNYTVNGKEYYRIRKTIGHKADGSPIIKTFYGDGLKEAEEKADAYLNKIKNGFNLDFEKVTVAELLKIWLFNIKLVAVKPSTFVSYESNYRLYIAKSNLALMKVCNVKKIHIQNFYNALFETKSTEKIKSIHKLLHSFFEYAVEEGYIIKNPCHKAIIPKNTLEKSENKKLDIFTIEELNYIKEKFKRK